MGNTVIEKAKARVAYRPQEHPYECECWDCCLLIGAGEREPGTPMMEAIKWAIEGALYADR